MVACNCSSNGDVSIHETDSLDIHHAGPRVGGQRGGAAARDIAFRNVSCDPTRELYENDNAAFVKDWNDKTGDNVTINPSHGGITSPRGVAPSGTRETTTEKKFAIL